MRLKEIYIVIKNVKIKSLKKWSYKLEIKKF